MIKKYSVSIVFLLLFSIPPGIHLAYSQINMDVGGYMQNWYIANQQTDILLDDGTITSRHVDGFRLRRARLTVRGHISETFSATTWVELAGTTPTLLDFHVDAHISPWFNLRAGQFIMPGQAYDTGRLVSSRLIFYDRAAVSTALSKAMGYDFFRDIGLMAYGKKGRLWYGVHAGNGTGRFQQAGSNITERGAGGGLYGARVDLEPVDGFTLGGHISKNRQRDVVQNGTGPFDINRRSYSIRAATNNLGFDGLFSQFEYMKFASKDDLHGIVADPEGTYNLHGFYAELGYRITRDWHILGRYDEMVQKPGQTIDTERNFSNRYVFGVSRYIHSNHNEIVRAHLNYSFGQAGPMNLEDSIIVLVFQIRFIP